MAQSFARHSPCQNPHNSKDKLASGTPTKVSNHCTLTPTATCAPIPAAAPVVAPLAASGSADSSVVRYLEDDLKRILRTVLDFKPPTLVPALIVAAAPYSEGPRERSLKV